MRLDGAALKAVPRFSISPASLLLLLWHSSLRTSTNVYDPSTVAKRSRDVTGFTFEIVRSVRREARNVPAISPNVNFAAEFPSVRTERVGTPIGEQSEKMNDLHVNKLSLSFICARRNRS